MNSRSISFRLGVWHVGLLAVFFGLLCALLYLDLRHFLENDLRRAGERRTHQISSVFLAHVQPGGESAIAHQAKDWYEPEINNRFIRITRADGKAIYVSGRPNDGSFDPVQIPAPALAVRPEKNESFQKIKLFGGKTILIVTSRYPSASQPEYLVEYGELLNPIDTMLNHLFLQLALGLPLAILIIAIGGWMLVRNALIPVEQITTAAERITQHNLSERLPVTKSGDELERLSLSLNRMIKRLDHAFQNSKRFVADASHELRTPLTILRGELEDFSEDPHLTAEVRDRVASLHEEVIHLGKIVEQLLTLSRLDAGEAQTEWSRFDLADLARTTADQMGLLAEDKNISIVCDVTPPVPIEGDRVRLKQVIVNLLDNAIKYTPEKGTVKLVVTAVKGDALLEVSDNGLGIPAHALPHVFERFYRVDQSRATESESTGLGLAIVKSICTAHGAEVEAQSTPSQGSSFRVKLPLAKS